MIIINVNNVVIYVKHAKIKMAKVKIIVQVVFLDFINLLGKIHVKFVNSHAKLVKLQKIIV